MTINSPWNKPTGTPLSPCSYGQKSSRLARKHFEEFTSEISPCYENNMKSYIVFIWGKTFPIYRELAC